MSAVLRFLWQICDVNTSKLVWFESCSAHHFLKTKHFRLIDRRVNLP